MDIDKQWLQVMSGRIDTIKVGDNGEIDIESFLDAMEGNVSRAYVVVFGGEGLIQGQLTGDLENNLKKVRRHFEKNKENTTFDKLAEFEVKTYGKAHLLATKDVGVKGILWLTRTLNFITTLVEGLVNHNGKHPTEVAKETYAKTLQPFHGFLASTTFSTALGWTSDSETLLKLFGFKSEEEFKKEALIFLTKMKPLIEKNFAVLDKYDVHFTYKV